MRLAWVLGLAVVACVCAQTHAEKEAVERLVPPQKASAHQHVPREREFEAPIDQWPANGVPGDVNVYPSFEERAMGTWLNVVCT